jgi:hypothetical protein
MGETNGIESATTAAQATHDPVSGHDISDQITLQVQDPDSRAITVTTISELIEAYHRQTGKAYQYLMFKNSQLNPAHRISDSMLGGSENLKHRTNLRHRL